ncbi:MAG: FMN-binding protein [Oscillospiraceae bacterium]|nr:FMN-binding protein [Oscillospiraceae bacterium]
MKKRNILLGAVLLCGLCLAGCGEDETPKNYKDGTYTAKSEQYVNDDEADTAGNGYGVVTLTIKDNKITECEFKTYELDGTLKDAEYGKENGEIANRDFYNKAQKAVGACDQYASRLVEKGSLKGVDAISGATINYGEFKEAVSIALEQAAQ